jgi:hypothetical protein
MQIEDIKYKAKIKDRTGIYSVNEICVWNKTIKVRDPRK